MKKMKRRITIDQAEERAREFECLTVKRVNKGQLNIVFDPKVALNPEEEKKLNDFRWLLHYTSKRDDIYPHSIIYFFGFGVVHWIEKVD